MRERRLEREREGGRTALEDVPPGHGALVPPASLDLAALPLCERARQAHGDRLGLRRLSAALDDRKHVERAEARRERQGAHDGVAVRQLREVGRERQRVDDDAPERRHRIVDHGRLDVCALGRRGRRRRRGGHDPHARAALLAAADGEHALVLVARAEPARLAAHALERDARRRHGRRLLEPREELLELGREAVRRLAARSLAGAVARRRGGGGCAAGRERDGVDDEGGRARARVEGAVERERVGDARVGDEALEAGEGGREALVLARLELGAGAQVGGHVLGGLPPALARVGQDGVELCVVGDRLRDGPEEALAEQVRARLGEGGVEVGERLGERGAGRVPLSRGRLGGRADRGRGRRLDGEELAGSTLGRGRRGAGARGGCAGSQWPCCGSWHGRHGSSGRVG